MDANSLGFPSIDKLEHLLARDVIERELAVYEARIKAGETTLSFPLMLIDRGLLDTAQLAQLDDSGVAGFGAFADTWAPLELPAMSAEAPPTIPPMSAPDATAPWQPQPTAIITPPPATPSPPPTPAPTVATSAPITPTDTDDALATIPSTRATLPTSVAPTPADDDDALATIPSTRPAAPVSAVEAENEDAADATLAGGKVATSLFWHPTQHGTRKTEPSTSSSSGDGDDDDFDATMGHHRVATSMRRHPGSAGAGKSPDAADDADDEAGRTVANVRQRGSLQMPRTMPGGPTAGPTFAPPDSGGGGAGAPFATGGSNSDAPRPGVATRMGFGSLVNLHHRVDDEHERFGRYLIVGRLGKGGMGEVVAARDTDLNRDIALKLMLAGIQTNKSQIEKFLVEAQVTGQLEHPNIVPVHELGITRDNKAYFTMKYVRGQSFKGILGELKRRETGEPAAADGGANTQTPASNGPAAKTYSLTDLLDIFLKICDAVAFAHSKGVVHRDLKPENVMVGSFGEVLVMDWGLAKVRGIEDKVATAVKVDLSRGDVTTAARGGDTSQEIVQTMDGTILGTPMFMPPEQARGDVEDIDHRSDIYSLGAILYQILTLEYPVTGRTSLDVLVKVAQGKFDPPSVRAPQRKISPELEAVVLKAMAHAKENRYQTVENLQADIRAFIDGRALSAVNYSLLGLAMKWVQRNRRLAIGIGSSVLVALIVFLVTVQVQAMNRRADIAAFLAGADAQIGQAESLISAAQFEPALTALDNARSDFDRVLGLDQQHETGKSRRDDVLAKRIAVQQLIKERDIQLRREMQHRDAERWRSEAESHLVDAEAFFVESRQALAEASAQWRENLQRELFDRFERAVFAIGRARDLHGERSEINALAERIATTRALTVSEWEREIRLIDQRVRAYESVRTGDRELAAGRVEIAAAHEILAGEMPIEGQSAEEAAAERRGLAFSHVLSALGAFSQAAVMFEQVQTDAAGIAAAREGRLNALLELAYIAIRNREFKLAEAWLGQAVELFPESAPDERIAAVQADWVTEKRKAEGYDEALDAGRTRFDAGDYQQAITYFERAQEWVATSEIAEEIRRAYFHRALQASDAARQQGRWLAAFVYLDQAEPHTVGNDLRAAELAARRDDVIRTGTDDLLQRVREALGTDEIERAEVAVTECVALNPQSRDAARLLAEIRAKQVAPDGFVFVASGRVTLGTLRESDLNPLRTVDLPAFYMAVNEVTVAEYRRFVEAGGYARTEFWSAEGLAFIDRLPLSRRVPANWETQTQADWPVVGVSAFEAEAYANWLTTHANANGGNDNGGAAAAIRYRLPTDAEWELVARHTPTDRTGNGRVFPWGNEWAQGGSAISATRLAPPGSRSADISAFGVRDLGFNAAEWVIADAPTDKVPFALRGASSLTPPALRERFATTTKRGVAEPANRAADIGFRLVRVIGSD